MKKIIICATQRCGSTMVCEDFRNTGVLGLPEEYFIPWTREDENANWQKKMNNMIETKKANGVFSVKIMADQLPHVERKISTFFQAECKEKESIFHQFFKDALWVRVWRQDKIRQAISRVMVNRTHICHATENANDEHFAGKIQKGYDKNYNLDAKFDYGLIKSAINKIVKEEAIWNQFFRNNGIKPLRIIYEDVINDTSYLSKIANKISVDLPENIPARKMVKLSNAISEDWYERYTKMHAIETR